jgi:hypothetical protein
MVSLSRCSSDGLRLVQTITVQYTQKPHGFPLETQDRWSFPSSTSRSGHQWRSPVQSMSNRPTRASRVPSQEEYEAQMKEKQIKALKRKARQLGLALIEKPAAGIGPAEAPV